MNYTDLSLEELEDLRKQREDAARIALNDLEFHVANVLNEEARKIQESGEGSARSVPAGLQQSKNQRR